MYLVHADFTGSFVRVPPPTSEVESYLSVCPWYAQFIDSSIVDMHMNLLASKKNLGDGLKYRYSYCQYTREPLFSRGYPYMVGIATLINYHPSAMSYSMSHPLTTHAATCDDFERREQPFFEPCRDPPLPTLHYHPA